MNKFFGFLSKIALPSYCFSVFITLVMDILNENLHTFLYCWAALGFMFFLIVMQSIKVRNLKKEMELRKLMFDTYLAGKDGRMNEVDSIYDRKERY
jgi:hypothetical protein